MHRKGHTVSFAMFLCVFFLFPFTLFASEQISLYEVDIDIHEDSSITVLETIHYDFGSSSRRGIYRDIPIRYDTPYGTRGIDLNVVSVSRDGYEEEYTESREGRDIRVRIGDPDVYIEGEHVYRITYKVSGAFNAFSEYDELYWNAIGNNWNVPILEAHVHIDAPSVILDAACYEGVLGATLACSDIAVDRDTLVAGTFDLQPGNGFTVALSLPKGAVTLPGILETLWRLLLNNIILLLPVIVFFVMYRVWERHGKDAKGRGTIIAQYEPPTGMSPILMGALTDGVVNDEDITAGIIYLAEQGYITIERTEEKRFLGSKVDYVLTWVGDFSELNHKEQLVAELLFDINVHKGQLVTFSSLQKDGSTTHRRKRLVEHIDSDLKAQGFFLNKPHATVTKWVVAPIIFIFLSVMLFDMFKGVGVVSLLLSAVIVLLFGIFMPKLTKKGALAREHIEGFRDFLNVTLKERLKFHNAPERTQTEFMEFLPFAIALGVEKKWAEQFKDMEMQSPSWYRGGSFHAFAPAAFAKDMTSFKESMSAGVSAPQGGSGSGGGGFSGGGMGGGGGGSW